jgi:hypothetical protein
MMRLQWVSLAILFSFLEACNIGGPSDKPYIPPPSGGSGGQSDAGAGGHNARLDAGSDIQDSVEVHSAGGAGGDITPDAGSGGDTGVGGFDGSLGGSSIDAGAPGSLPCDVQSLLVSRCQTCHSARPIGGAPMPLVTYSDLMRQSLSDPSQTNAQLAVVRMQSLTAPMPPAPFPAPSATEVSSFSAWVMAGAVSTDCDPDAGPVAMDAGSSPDGGMGTVDGSTDSVPVSLCSTPSVIQDPTPLRKLSRVQYMNAISDVITQWEPKSYTGVLQNVNVQLIEQAVPQDTRVTGDSTHRGGFRRLDQDEQQDQVDAVFNVAQAVATEVIRGGAQLNSFLGECATNFQIEDDYQCIQDFIKRAGRIVERRILTPDDIAYYNSVYNSTGIDRAGINDVLVAMLMSPYFLFQIEHGDQPVDQANGVYALSGQELVNRLSFQFWNTIPDDTLNGMADSATILTDTGYANALQHVSSDPRSLRSTEEFFREYLSIEDLAEMNRLSGTARFDAVRGSFSPTGNTRENMISEMAGLAIYYTQNGSFDDLFTTTKSFATTPDVAQIYGTPVWDGVSDPPDMPDTQHVGLLTHAAMVASGISVTRPVIKGVVTRTLLLCDQLGSPPANAMMVAQNEQMALNPLTSTRVLTQSLTETRPDCATCHQPLINPLGFVTENFDPLGRLRTSESVFDDAGHLLGIVPVDTSSIPRIDPIDGTTAVTDAADLQLRMLASGKLQDCMARKYFRFTYGKIEDSAGDQCVIRSLSSQFKSKDPLGASLVQFANTPAFKQRRFN